MMISYILDWPTAFESNAKTCGGKGWNLARLDHYGFTIPKGFVITTRLYQEIITQPSVSVLLREIQHQAIEALADSHNKWLKEVELTFLGCHLPETFKQTLENVLVTEGLKNSALAVRSSATMEDGDLASFAGIHESFLNVQSTDEIEKSILKSFASLWSSRAMSYRRKLKIVDDDVEAAIVICEMVEAKSSGVAFSCDPSGCERDAILINANFGLGESLVSGVIEPDQYKVQRFHNKVFETFIGRKEKKTVVDITGTKLVDQAEGKQQCLKNNEIEQLARYTDRIFYALGEGEKHQDVEWVFDGRQFVILQSRPVTKVLEPEYEGVLDSSVYWCNGNFRDALPMVLGVLGREFCQYRIDHILHDNFHGLAYKVKKGFSFARSYNGRFYCNASLLQWLWFDIVGVDPKLTCTSLGGHQKTIEIEESYKKGLKRKLGRFWRMLQFVRVRDSYIKRKDEIFENSISFTEAQRKKDLTCLSNDELINDLVIIEQAMDDYDRSFIFLTSASGALMALVQILEKHVGDEAYSLANELLEGKADITTANQGYELVSLAEIAREDDEAYVYFSSEQFDALAWNECLSNSSVFKSGFLAYLEEYAHRAVYEMDLSNARWREDPAYLIQCVKVHFDAKTVVKRKQKHASDAAWAKVKKNIPIHVRPLVKKFVRESIEGAALKEASKSVYSRYVEALRYILLEIGNRLLLNNLIESRDDIFHCARVEFLSIINGDWNGVALGEIVSKRIAIKRTQEKIEAPDLIIDDQPEQANAIPLGDSNYLKGMGVATGVATGKARLIYSPDQGHQLEKGEVLVAPSTEPSWTPLFLNASAIVVETGGFLSHGSIVAREYGIPAVVNVAGVMRSIPNGKLVEVNGNKGLVRLVD